MVTIVKHEWHQHDRQYAIEIDENILVEIYPDLDEVEIAAKLQALEEGISRLMKLWATPKTMMLN